MSLPTNPNLLMAGGTSPYYNVQRSLRFRASASAYLNRTPAGAGNQKTWVWSGWVKRGALGNYYYFWSINQASGPRAVFGFDNTDKLTFQTNSSGSAWDTVVTTNSVYRDPSSWYHIVLAVDTTSATSTITGSSTDRVRIYINGVQVTSFSSTTVAAQNTNLPYNAALPHNIGAWQVNSYYLDGYLSEINFIDGQALTPSSFGYTDPYTGVWMPEKYNGTYGTNGFYLPFTNTTNTTNLCLDASGNGNNWTPNNISLTAGVTYDSMLDVPTNWGDGGNGRGNYATFNPLAVTSVAATFAEANLKVTTGGAGGNGYGTIAIPSSGKWYWEITCGSGNSSMIGVSAYLSTQTYAWQNSNSVFYYNNGQKYIDGTGSAYGATYTTNDIIGIAVDSGAGTITFYKNNVSQGSISHSMDGLFPSLADGASATTDIFYANFGQRPFAYTPPSGFKTLNTLNLPTPTILNGAKYMAATTYTGNGTTQTISNGTGSGNNPLGVTFQPDFVWLKGRSLASNHNLSNVVTGASYFLFSNSTSAEVGNANVISAYTTTGFTVGNDIYANQSTSTYVGWQWNAGSGSSSIPSGGTITPTGASINTTAGFSIITYTGTSTTGTVPHGLGVAPKMIIVKTRNAVADWYVYHASNGTNKYMYMNLTNAVISAAGYFDTVSSTVFGGTSAAGIISTNNFVAYCFAEVAGYSKFGSYTGNGSADGPFVYCGFRPRYILQKRTDTTGTWEIYDTSRDTYNIMSADLSAESAAAEVSTARFDFLSNGFKIRTTGAATNASSGTYIYAAFAENPFNVSRAR